MRRRGFTLVEIIIAIMIMGILAGTMTLSPKGARQTARKEAERVASFVDSAIRRADRLRVICKFSYNEDEKVITLTWYQSDTFNTELNIGKRINNELKASSGCSYSFGSNGTEWVYSRVQGDLPQNQMGDNAYVTILEQEPGTSLGDAEEEPDTEPDPNNQQNESEEEDGDDEIIGPLNQSTSIFPFCTIEVTGADDKTVYVCVASSIGSGGGNEVDPDPDPEP